MLHRRPPAASVPAGRWARLHRVPGGLQCAGCRSRAQASPTCPQGRDAGTLAPQAGSNFIRAMIRRDAAAGTRTVLRFPPEPNGQLHIGHAKAICLNFGLAKDFELAVCNLRFDDTNPARASEEHMRAIQRDIRWLGYQWDGPTKFASDYFGQLHALATELIVQGKAFVCSLPHQQALEQRGTARQIGTPSPYRERSVEENLALWREICSGDHPDGSHVLRAKIDPPDVSAPMASPNLRMRDPVMYRIRHRPKHARVVSGELPDSWCVYPTYDWAHCMSDAIEGVTHSLCTLEFVDHNEIYDWFVRNAPPIIVNEDVDSGCGKDGGGAAVSRTEPRRSYPRQTEYGRLNLEYTVTSKRKLAALVEAGVVEGWDDPRMPTLAGLRRRGIPAAAIRLFCSRVGVTRVGGSVIEQSMLDTSVREVLEGRADNGQANPTEMSMETTQNWVTPRAMAVRNPLPVTLTSLTEPLQLSLPHHPDHVETLGHRAVPLTREIFIDRSDFMEEDEAVAMPGGFKRLTPGQAVRLRGAHVIRCTEILRDPASGEVVRLHCEHDESTLGKKPVGYKAAGVIHWVSAEHGVPVTLRHFGNLFRAADAYETAQQEEDQEVELEAPSQTADTNLLLQNLDPSSLVEYTGVAEPSVLEAVQAGSTSDSERTRRCWFQFEREGYYVLDERLDADGRLRTDGTQDGALVFNMVVGLRQNKSSRTSGRKQGGKGPKKGAQKGGPKVVQKGTEGLGSRREAE